MSTCRHCVATIRFIHLDTGSTIPVNPIPTPTGTVAASPQGTSLVGHVVSKTKPALPGQQLYRVHRADCHPDKPRVDAAGRRPSLFDSDKGASDV